MNALNKKYRIVIKDFELEDLFKMNDENGGVKMKALVSGTVEHLSKTPGNSVIKDQQNSVVILCLDKIPEVD